MNLKHRSDAAVQMERGNYYFGQQALGIHLRLSDARLFGEAVGIKHHFAELPDHILEVDLSQRLRRRDVHHQFNDKGLWCNASRHNHFSPTQENMEE